MLENPKTAEYQVVRTSLLPGLLKTIRENRSHSLPLRTFEVSDVAFKDENEPERCASNERRVAAVYCDKSASFEVVHGLLDKLMRALDVPRLAMGDAGKQKGYWIEEAESESRARHADAGRQLIARTDPTFFPGRAAKIFFRPGPGASAAASSSAAKAVELPSELPPASESASVPLPQQASGAAAEASKAKSSDSDKGPLASVADTLGRALADVTSAASEASSGLKRRLHSASHPSGAVEIGTLGVVHPEVLKAFEIDYPCSAMEFDLEPFL